MFNKNNKKVIKVDGMHCEHCVKSIEQALIKLNIDKVKVNLKRGEVTLYYKDNIDLTLVKSAIQELGFEYKE